MNDIFNLLRAKSWIKNILIFLPCIFVDNVFNYQHLLHFIYFSILASSVYLFNDISDLKSDKLHKVNHRRALASGLFSLKFAYSLLVFLIALVSFVSIFLIDNIYLVIIAILYLSINIFYSLYAKYLIFLDILILSSFYIMRIIYGFVLFGAAISFWFLLYSFFIFLFLASVKRVSELRNDSTNNRSYSVNDIPILLNLGISSIFASIFFLGLYYKFENNNFFNSKYLIFVFGILQFYLFVRTIFLANRGLIQYDPLDFFMKDKLTLLLIFISILILITNLYV